jgi:transcription initiation factor TFIIH subunit 4
MTSARARAVGRAQNKLNQTILSDFVGWASSSPDKLDDLYESPHATQCVLRALPPVARLYVARVLYLPAAAPEFSPSVFREALCRRTRARDRHDSALNTLRALRVFVPLSDGDDGGGGGAGVARLALNPAFARQLRLSVACMVPPVFGGPVDGVAARDVPSLDLFSARRLERVLNFSIGGDAEDASGVPHAAAAPRQEIQNALSSTRILAPCDGGAFMQITSTGFQFLLKDSSAQVWVLLRDVINNSFAGAELEALNFVFQLSFARSGFPYALDSVSSEQRRLVACLDELGIIAVDGSFFFPTPLGIGLVASASRSADDTTRAARQTLASAKSSGDIEIVVETNFRLYACVRVVTSSSTGAAAGRRARCDTC